jgi:hypothetical protein
MKESTTLSLGATSLSPYVLIFPVPHASCRGAALLRAKGAPPSSSSLAEVARTADLPAVASFTWARWSRATPTPPSGSDPAEVEEEGEVKKPSYRRDIPTHCMT